MRMARGSGIGAVVALAAASAGVVGCGAPGDDQETGSISRDDVLEARAALPAGVVAALDSGNAAYREGRYDEARGHYRDATRQGEDVAAAWFGLYMAELALGNSAAADSAMDRAQRLAPGASLIHPAEPDSTP